MVADVPHLERGGLDVYSVVARYRGHLRIGLDRENIKVALTELAGEDAGPGSDIDHKSSAGEMRDGVDGVSRVTRPKPVVVDGGLAEGLCPRTVLVWRRVRGHRHDPKHLAGQRRLQFRFPHAHPGQGVEVTVRCMSHVIVDATSIPAGHGPHPAASPYDRRISEALNVTAFEVYQVELPPGAETVPHNHLDDRNDDVYAIIAGDGWIVIDDQPYPVMPGQFVSVELQHRRHLRAGPHGLTFIAICAEQRP